MTWRLTSDVELFEKQAGQFLRSEPVRHTVLLTVVAALRSRGPHVYGTDDPILGWWTSPAGSVEGAMLQTPPYPLTLTEVPPEAVPEAAYAIADRGLLNAANLLVKDIPAFTDAWLSRAGGTCEAGMRSRLFRLTELTPPDPMPIGAARQAAPSDRALLVDWFSDFYDYIGERPSDVGPVLDDRLSGDGITIWEAAGEPVAMAARSRIEAAMARIQYVYTPPVHRRQGFGGAATTAATRKALDAGATEVVLFTDLSNPTSNALYPRLGYRPIEDRAVVEFSS
ncbi:GNAT family N-acetyltransferase [Actinoplanes derwentensis]|uniref:FR47-like protein n=1 Tax=Actinoplanes derwentensis TaxID=113562 RepID=A0A1H2CLQ6_9ACTN|nr:GNAT family N-acetyltransferase [Actinoplanes derwentensis]GID82791.1 N-acetyltransferase [Actinoplanes derwentensis]SDT71448.1 FR47-like protein [Actinoplanes derwentensis]